jgi:hypothetical protein
MTPMVVDAPVSRVVPMSAVGIRGYSPRIRDAATQLLGTQRVNQGCVQRPNSIMSMGNADEPRRAPGVTAPGARAT